MAGKGTERPLRVTQALEQAEGEPGILPTPPKLGIHFWVQELDNSISVLLGPK